MRYHCFLLFKTEVSGVSSLKDRARLNNVVYAKGRTKKENRHIKYNLSLYFGTSDFLYQCLIVIFPSLGSGH